MIRFIDLKQQYWLPGGDEREHFAFIDTVVDRFVEVI